MAGCAAFCLSRPEPDRRTACVFFRDRKWHVGGAVVAALAFSFGGSAASRIQHVGQVESLIFLPLSLWMLARALERSSWRSSENVAPRPSAMRRAHRERVERS